MAINLDEIVAGSSSVDELMKALSAESESSTVASKQMLQLAQAAQGSLNPLNWLKSKVSPRSAAGILSTDQEYKQYYIDTASQGDEPLSREEFLKQKQMQQQKGRG
jgi:hypothetical protein